MLHRSANKDSIAALMLENTFTSIPDIAKILFPLKLIKCLPGIGKITNPAFINNFLSSLVL